MRAVRILGVEDFASRMWCKRLLLARDWVGGRVVASLCDVMLWPISEVPMIAIAETRPAAVATSPRLLVSLATYDEAKNLRPLVLAIRDHAPHASILIIDDNSPDGTGQIADELRA